MRLAAIDCGTNTLLLLVADFEDGQIAAVEDRAEIVRLGEGLDASGALQPRAIARALATLDGYVARIGELGCAHVMAVGTEAIRRASNGHLFVNEATARLGRVGGRFQVIDGEREARLSWRAVNASFPELRGARTVLDIGGGSTELLVGEREVERVVSLPIGSVRLTERLLHHDPPLADERAALHAAIERALDEAPPPRGTLVGIAGTVTTLAAMAQRLTTYDGDRVHGSILDGKWLAETVRALGETPVADRKRTPGLDPKRADVIYAGAVILERVLARAGASGCLVSDRGIRWGLIYEAIGLG
ncbi:MAG TPA: Ppx/GppA phosphatase family protein [Polyangia bacterium]|nr:Ppx/GppA phosphatase family protein [Polyangia bacterium]